MKSRSGNISGYIIKKILQVVVFMIILSLIVFILAELAPGDPLKAYYGDSLERMSEEQISAARERLALDDSPVKRYFTWAGNALQGDFGISYQYKENVIDVISDLFLNTVLLGGIAFILTFVLAVLLGVYSSAREGKPVDKIIHKAGVLSSTIPSFFIALVFILVFAVNLGWLPTGGAYSVGGGGLTDRIIHLILPVGVLVVGHLWYYAYIIRNKMSEELKKDYVEACRIKGIGNRDILFKHCLKNILPSVVTLMAISLPHILAGTYIVEMVFSYPGLGMLSFESAKYNDYNMLLILCLITGFVVIIGNMIGEVVSERMDPRMRRRGEVI